MFVLLALIAGFTYDELWRSFGDWDQFSVNLFIFVLLILLIWNSLPEDDDNDDDFPTTGTT